LIAGGYVQVRFTGAQPEAPLTVPATALIFRAEGAQVAVIEEGGVVRFRRVMLGRDFGTTVQVLEGITAADQVVVNPPDSLTDGTVVERVP
jgi:multidrug efflux pump subunit AcrA (membrane-fusion protein)